MVGVQSATTRHGAQRRGRLRHSDAVHALPIICAAQFVLRLDFSIVTVALPTIQADLHMAAAQLQWIVTGYALTFGAGEPYPP
jgi:MFS family permease